MNGNPTLHIRQNPSVDGKYPIRLTLKQPNQPDLEGEATIEFELTDKEQSDLRWYLEDYLRLAALVEDAHVAQIEHLMVQRGEELYTKVLTANLDIQKIWFAIRSQLADLRVEIATGVAEAASIPWELMRDPESDSPIALRVRSFVRVQSNPNLNFVSVPEAEDHRFRLLYVVCRPKGTKDVGLRAVANRLLHDLGDDLARYDITALRPPTFEQLQKELTDAKEAGRPYHIVHFDGHGMYADLSKSKLDEWAAALSSVTLGGEKPGKHGYLLFEAPGSDEKMRPVPGDELGKLLHDTGVPALVLNACQSAMHEAAARPEQTDTVHDEVRAIGSLSQAVIDQGIPAVLGMRYSVFVVTAAQYIGELYASLAKGRGFGQAATEGRKHLQRNPERWVGLQPRPLQDWFVPVVYEATGLQLFPDERSLQQLDQQPQMDPVQLNPSLLRYVPDQGFVGRDETLLLVDRAFDDHPVVLLHAYAGQGKTTTSVEFARWYAQTGGLGPQPVVLFTSFETHTDLDDLLNQIGQRFTAVLQANGIEWHALNDTAERRNLVFQLLRQVPVLWIWDNVELVAGFPEGTESAWTADEQSALADFLKLVKLDNATKVRILITSRRDEQAWLGGVPHRVKMPRMSDADAASLALQLGHEAQLTRSEIADWQPLLDYCAGNPLTLRVIAGQAVRMRHRSKARIEHFIQAVRDGEQRIEDVDEAQGRDKSLGASLDYGFRNAFKGDELPIIALLHLFQGTVDVDALDLMGKGDHALPELQGQTKEGLARLLKQASDAGLLMHLGSTYYNIHPALPWYLQQLFTRHYDGQDGRSTAEAALRAWSEAIGRLGNEYHNQLGKGNGDVIKFLALEEANLLNARRQARRHEWWVLVIPAMQGLSQLYEYEGRMAEWARLVTEITLDYCTKDDEPVTGREDEYGFVMHYRVRLMRYKERNLARAAELQGKLVKFHRQQASTVFALPDNAPLDNVQRNRIRTLGISMENLGSILREQGSSDCVKQYEEAIQQHQLIKDTAAEAKVHFNLGRTYYDLPDIRNLDEAEAAYQCSLDLREPNDAVGRVRCIHQIGMVHHERYREAFQQKALPEILLTYAEAAEKHYQKSLALCPASAITDLGPIHGQLGNLYREFNQMERAREHYEKAAQYFQQAGNRYYAGGTRFNIAVMYGRAAEQEESPSDQHSFMLRAQAYARAALRDYQHYEGRAAADEARVQQLLDDIEQRLDALPE